MKKYYVYLYPVLVSVVMGSIYVIGQNIKLSNWDTLFVANSLLMILFNMIISPIYLAIVTNSIISNSNLFWIPVMISNIISVLIPFIYNIMWAAINGYAHVLSYYRNDIGASCIIYYQIIIPAAIMISFSMIEFVRFRIMPKVKEKKIRG